MVEEFSAARLRARRTPMPAYLRKERRAIARLKISAGKMEVNQGHLTLNQ